MATTADIELIGDIKLQTPLTAERQAREFERRVLKNFSVGAAPLGRLTGKVSEFDKSLEAANARVIAFGASAGVIAGITTALQQMVSQAIKVEKTLLDINVLFGQSASGLAAFSDSLFDVAKNTGQSFFDVAEAAKEFSRQGLGVEETLSRTSDAMILARLTGLEFVKSVEQLTASVNQFSKEGLTTADVINRLANVDAKFAVSAKDLSEGLSRAGSVAQDAGASFNELIALITAVQQRTARGGAVIGNALKTIFTRAQRSDTLDSLEQLGIGVRDLEGKTLPVINILSELSQKYDSLGSSQQAFVSELVGGGYQINIVKSLFDDLGRVVPEYSKALDAANKSTDEAYQRNELLNKSLASLANEAGQNLTKLAASVGKITLGPALENIFGLINSVGDSIDGKGIGEKIGTGILTGIGDFIGGPGLVYLLALAGKLFKKFGSFAKDSIGEVLSLGAPNARILDTQKGIVELLNKDIDARNIINSTVTSQVQKEQQLIALIKERVALDARANSASLGLSRNLVNQGVIYKPAQGTFRTKAGGHMPMSINSVPREAIVNEVMGAKKAGYSIQPSDVRVMKTQIDGKPTTVVYNNKEKVIHDYMGSGEPAIIPPTGRIQNYPDGFLNLGKFATEARRFPEILKSSELAKQFLTENIGISERKLLPIIFSSRRSTGLDARYLPGKRTEVYPDSIINFGKDQFFANIKSGISGPSERQIIGDRFSDTILHESFHYGFDKNKKAALKFFEENSESLLMPSNKAIAMRFLENIGGKNFAKYYSSYAQEEVMARQFPRIFNRSGGGVPQIRNYSGGGKFVKDSFGGFEFDHALGGGLIDIDGEEASIAAFDTKKPGKGNSSKVYKAMLSGLKERGIKTVSGSLIPQHLNVPRDNSPKSQLLARYPQLIRSRLGKSNVLAGEYGQIEVSNDDVDKNPSKLLAFAQRNQNLELITTLAGGYMNAALGLPLQTYNREELFVAARKLGVKIPERLTSKTDNDNEIARFIGSSKQHQALVSRGRRLLGQSGIPISGVGVSTLATTRGFSAIDKLFEPISTTPALSELERKIQAENSYGLNPGFQKEQQGRYRTVSPVQEALGQKELSRPSQPVLEKSRQEKEARDLIERDFKNQKEARRRGEQITRIYAAKSRVQPFSRTVSKDEIAQLVRQAEERNRIEAASRIDPSIYENQPAFLSKSQGGVGIPKSRRELATERLDRIRNSGASFSSSLFNFTNTDKLGRRTINEARNQKFSSGAFSASFAAPLLGGLASEAFGSKDATDQRSNRKIQGVASSIGAGAALGATFGGPIGAAIGASVAIIGSYNSIIENSTKSFEDLNESLGMETQQREKTLSSLKGFSDAIEVLQSTSLSPTQRREAQNRAQSSLSGLDSATQAELLDATKNQDFKKVQEINSRIAEERTRKVKAAELVTTIAAYKEKKFEGSASLGQSSILGSIISSVDVNKVDEKQLRERTDALKELTRASKETEVSSRFIGGGLGGQGGGIVAQASGPTKNAQLAKTKLLDQARLVVDTLGFNKAQGDELFIQLKEANEEKRQAFIDLIANAASGDVAAAKELVAITDEQTAARKEVESNLDTVRNSIRSQSLKLARSLELGSIRSEGSRSRGAQISSGSISLLEGRNQALSPYRSEGANIRLDSEIELVKARVESEREISVLQENAANETKKALIGIKKTGAEIPDEIISKLGGGRDKFVKTFQGLSSANSPEQAILTLESLAADLGKNSLDEDTKSIFQKLAQEIEEQKSVLEGIRNNTKAQIENSQKGLDTTQKLLEVQRAERLAIKAFQVSMSQFNPRVLAENGPQFGDIAAGAGRSVSRGLERRFSSTNPDNIRAFQLRYPGSKNVGDIQKGYSDETLQKAILDIQSLKQEFDSGLLLDPSQIEKRRSSLPASATSDLNALSSIEAERKRKQDFARQNFEYIGARGITDTVGAKFQPFLGALSSGQYNTGFSVNQNVGKSISSQIQGGQFEQVQQRLLSLLPKVNSQGQAQIRELIPTLQSGAIQLELNKKLRAPNEAAALAGQEDKPVSVKFTSDSLKELQQAVKTGVTEGQKAPSVNSSVSVNVAGDATEKTANAIGESVKIQMEAILDYLFKKDGFVIPPKATA